MATFKLLLMALGPASLSASICNLTTLDLVGRAADLGALWLPRPFAIRSRVRHLARSLRRKPSAWTHAVLGALIKAFPVESNASSAVADRHLHLALRLEPSQPHALLARAQNLCPSWQTFSCSQPSRTIAIGILEKALRVHQWLWEARLMLAVLLALQGDLERAQAGLAAAWQLAPMSRQVAGTGGSILRHVGLVREADAFFQVAVDAGLWHSVDQRPQDVFWPKVPALGEFPSYEHLPEEFEFAKTQMQDHWMEIRKEVLSGLQNQLGSGYCNLHYDSSRGLFMSEIGQRGKGRWEEIYILSQEAPVWWVFESSRKCRAGPFPFTCGIIQSIQQRMHILRVVVSVVWPPSTHIPIHSSKSQGRLRLQCPLHVPQGATSRLKVGKRTKDFVEGECWWFDESYEHSLDYAHPDQPRVSIYLDSLQPGVREKDLISESALKVVAESPPLSPAYWGEVACRHRD